jgi:hypothetical protein
MGMLLLRYKNLTSAVPVWHSVQHIEISRLIYSEPTLNSLSEYVGTITLAYVVSDYSFWKDSCPYVYANINL